VTFGAQRTGYATCVPVAIVTGSDSGIGKATAVQLARDGFDLGITWHRDEQGANETAEEVRQLGRRAEVRQLDLLQLPGAAAVVDELIDALGGIDVLVNNSGTSREGKAVDLSYDQWRETLLVDLDGAFLCSQRAARKMIEQGHGGRIVNVTSVHEYKPIVDGVAYTVAKHGLGGLTKQLAFELGRHGITVNSVAPGMVATPMTDMEDEDPRQQGEARVPARASRRRARDRELHRLALLGRRRLDDGRQLRRRRRLPARQPELDAAGSEGGHVHGVVVVIAVKPSRSRIGRLVGSASTYSQP
jgi:NAD(P)-dependent dehydrogenase (short-subunit alcohol dehydrogenase family)